MSCNLKKKTEIRKLTDINILQTTEFVSIYYTCFEKSVLEDLAINNVPVEHH